MASFDQKLRILRLMEILLERTDDKNMLNASELCMILDQEYAIRRNREQYDKLTAELEELHQKQKAIQSEELLKAVAESSRSYEEILKFIQGNPGHED